MITLVTGTAASGKSLLAEKLVLRDDFMDRDYIATMKVMDEAGAERVKRHRAMRSDKGFVTIEIPSDITGATKYMKDPKKSVVLLECVANLVGNMMYDIPEMSSLCRTGGEGEDLFARSVVDNIKLLASKVGHLIVVTDEFDMSKTDDGETSLYKRLLAKVNIILKKEADRNFSTSDQRL